MSLSTAIKKSQAKYVKRINRGPIWAGPIAEGPQGGVTFSLLSRWLACKERFRLLVVEGLKPADAFNHRLHYGQMWHVCEESFAAQAPSDSRKASDGDSVSWQSALKKYGQELCRQYPLQQEQVEHWYNVCKVQFPLYVEFWSRHPDVRERTPLLQEQTFDVPYALPSGRTVRLRGKFDSVDLIGKGKDAGVYLQENKSKGDIDEQQIKRQLSFDLQTMLYLVALQEHPVQTSSISFPLKGVRYNVVKRPLSGGKGTITRHKGKQSRQLKSGKWSKAVPEETKQQFYDRLADYIRAEPETYFMRWRCEVTPSDIERFKRECLTPILEQLCDWYEWIAKEPKDPFGQDDSPDHHWGRFIHWRHPFGCYNVLNEGGSSDLDAFLETGSDIGLQRAENLFPELS